MRSNTLFHFKGDLLFIPLKTVLDLFPSYPKSGYPKIISPMYVTSFSSISYYSNVRLISNMQFRTNTSVLYLRYPCFNSWASPHTLTLVSISLMVVQVWYKSVFRIEDPVPYPLLNGGQNKGRLRSCPFPSIKCI